jgi:hypothetical protein
MNETEYLNKIRENVQQLRRVIGEGLSDSNILQMQAVTTRNLLTSLYCNLTDRVHELDSLESNGEETTSS